jgi:hypothetical protein
MKKSFIDGTILVTSAVIIWKLVLMPPLINVPPHEDAGFYWMTFLEPNQSVPNSADFTLEKDQTGFCYLAPLPDQRGMFFILPHPCNSQIRSIKMTEGDFESAESTPLDTGNFRIKGTRHGDGVYLVEMKYPDSTSRFAIRPATQSEVESLR